MKQLLQSRQVVFGFRILYIRNCNHNYCWLCNDAFSPFLSPWHFIAHITRIVDRSQNKNIYRWYNAKGILVLRQQFSKNQSASQLPLIEGYEIKPRDILKPCDT